MVRLALEGAELVVHSFLFTTGGHTFARQMGIPDISIQTFPMFAPTRDFPNVAMAGIPPGPLSYFSHWLATQIFWYGGNDKAPVVAQFGSLPLHVWDASTGSATLKGSYSTRYSPGLHHTCPPARTPGRCGERCQGTQCGSSVNIRYTTRTIKCAVATTACVTRIFERSLTHLTFGV